MNRDERPTMLTAYAFWIRRPIDSQPWPLIYSDEQRALMCPHRITPVTHVVQFAHAPVNVPTEEPKS